MNGSTFTGSIKPNSSTSSLTSTTVNIDSDSYWYVLDNSSINYLHNSGIVEFESPASSSITEKYKSINLNSYIGNGGSLIINTYVEQTGSPSDQIILNNGGNASGTTEIYVNKRGGLGAETIGKGILVINANNNATTSSDSFSLGQPVTAGAYNYQLYRNNDQSWYLTTNINPNPSPEPDPQPDYSEEPYAVAALPSLAQYYGLTTLGSRRERIGFDSFHNNSKNSIFWGRMSHNNGKHNGGFKYSPEFNSVAYTPNYNYNINFLQIGVDLLNLRKRNSDIKSGLFFTTGIIESDIRSYYENNKTLNQTTSKSKIKNNAIGAYWSKLYDSGSYIDIAGQYIHHRLEAKGESDNLFTKGHSWVLSAEAGYSYKLSDKLDLIPQAQIKYQSVAFNPKKSYARNIHIATYDFDKNKALQSRIGLEINYNNDKDYKIWSRIDFLHEFNGENKVLYKPLNYSPQNPQFISARKGNSFDFMLGADIALKSGISLYTSSGYQKGLSDRNKGSSWFINAGVKWNF